MSLVNLLLATFTAAGAQPDDLRQWGVAGAHCVPPGSDDPLYVTRCADGLYRAWWGRVHVAQWAEFCRQHDLRDPPEGLLLSTNHYAYANADELLSAVVVDTISSRLPGPGPRW